MNSFWRGRILVIIICLAVGFLDIVSVPSANGAEASLYISPTTGRRFVGETFQLAVRVNTGGQSINAAEGAIVFNAQKVEVVSISKTGSIFTLWTNEPSFSNAEGTISFSGGLPSPGYSGSSGLLMTITMRGKSATTLTNSTNIAMVSGAILANDGYGTNILTSLGRSSFFIAPLGTTEPGEEGDTSPPPVVSGQLEAPGVTSSTNPDQTKWYASKNPTLAWGTPDNASEVRLSITKSATSRPTVVYRPAINTKTLDELEDGVWYFHAQFFNSGGSSAITHYKLNVDATSPRSFSVQRIDSGDATNPQPEMVFTTTDATSGIDRYEVTIGTERITVSVADGAKPYKLPLQKPGTRDVTVKAFDKAGNTAVATTTITIAPIEKPIIERVTPEINQGEAVIVSGKAKPGVMVIVQAFKKDSASTEASSPAADMEVKADVNDQGLWSTVIRGLRSGEYAVSAFSQDERGAVSYSSDAFPVEVRGSFIGGIIRFFSKFSGLKGILPFVSLTLYVILISLLIQYLIFQRGTFMKRVSAAKEKAFGAAMLRKEEQARDKHLSQITSDMEKELELLKKISKHRPLYPEEKYLREKLVQYLKTLKVFNTKG